MTSRTSPERLMYVLSPGVFLKDMNRFNRLGLISLEKNRICSTSTKTLKLREEFVHWPQRHDCFFYRYFKRLNVYFEQIYLSEFVHFEHFFSKKEHLMDTQTIWNECI